MTATLAKELLEPGGWIAVLPGAVTDHEAHLVRLAQDLPLRGETLRIMGREVRAPRLQSWHGDPDASYKYSGRRFEPNPWTADLARLRDLVSGIAGATFNSVLVNYYRSGADSLALHSDDERSLGPNAPDDVLIASISLGAPRRFVLKARADGARRELDLGRGDVLLMGGALQRHWQHGVPKTAKPVGPRMNLTFRIVRSARS